MDATPFQLIPQHPGLHRNIRLYLKRDDLVHPLVQGNKWRKLHLLLQRLEQDGYRGVLSFGGAFSNHIHALSIAGPLFGLQTAAILRGTAADLNNPTLRDARAQGMALFPITKSAYDQKTAAPEVQEIIASLPGYYVLPEGGATAEGIAGCMPIGTEILAQAADTQGRLYIAIPAGTGCTAAGILAGAAEMASILVFPAAAYGVSADSIRDLLSTNGYSPHGDLHFFEQYILGRFAAPDPAILAFATHFEADFGIRLDPFYTARMLFGLFDLLKKDTFPPNSTLVAVHTGGLQAWRGLA